MKTKPISKGKSLLIHGGILIGAVILGFLLMMAAYLRRRETTLPGAGRTPLPNRTSLPTRR